MNQPKPKLPYYFHTSRRLKSPDDFDPSKWQGRKGATACVVLPLFWDAHQEAGDWRTMARWVHENLPYSSLEFFPKFWAFNISWHERPRRTVYSYAEPKGGWNPE
jgi:hypothetical protein